MLFYYFYTRHSKSFSLDDTLNWNLFYFAALQSFKTEVVCDILIWFQEVMAIKHIGCSMPSFEKKNFTFSDPNILVMLLWTISSILYILYEQVPYIQLHTKTMSRNNTVPHTHTHTCTQRWNCLHIGQSTPASVTHKRDQQSLLHMRTK